MNRREKTYIGRAVPLDREGKARVMAYAKAWTARNRQPGQHKGPLTRTFLQVLEALLWGFHNSRSGVCFPGYETIAAKAGCARSTVAEALKALEFAGVLGWQNRMVRIRERCVDLFGYQGWRWRVIRTSNAYQFRDPKPGASAPPNRGKSSRSENPPGTLNQEIHTLPSPFERAVRPVSDALQKALRGLGATLTAREVAGKML
jgi:hypothetical protein